MRKREKGNKMAEINWTKEQLEAITQKGSNILVAAAAGSGKTAVLVERIIRKIIDDGIDIDRMLVVTFTNAAASEMREKILEAIYRKIEEQPNNKNLQRQIHLINKAQICTIDSFCLDVIRNNFFEIQISANARVADTTEINLLQQEVLDEIFEEKYMEEDPNFLELIEKYTKYNRDEELEETILEIYHFMQTTPFPEDWLKEKVALLQEQHQTDNFSESIWGKVIIQYVKEVLDDCMNKAHNILEKIRIFPELNQYTNIIQEDISQYQQINNHLQDWDQSMKMIENMHYMKWPIDKKIENEWKQKAKEERDDIKAEFYQLKKIMTCNSQKAFQDLQYMHRILKILQDLILEFSEKFAAKKTEKNIIDFHDIEHLALKILINKQEDGIIRLTDVAKRYAEKFQEIAIDEYQDSNDIQELILKSVSRNHNIFMVGDVKQSIYKFRQACPEIFLEKYHSYSLDPTEQEDRKIQLFKNFRSRNNILDYTNMVFQTIMSRSLGEIEYNEDEYLNLGANYEEIKQNLKTELYVIDLKEKEKIWKDEEEQDENTETENVENIVLEARLVANKIRDLIQNRYQVFDKKCGMRDIQYKDIAILLRSANVVAPIFEKELTERGINVYSDSSQGYLDSVEVSTILCVLKVIHNPMQDLPLVTVMKSMIGNFTDNELLEISFEEFKGSFYQKMLSCIEHTENDKLKEKIQQFNEQIERWRQVEQWKPLDELIWQIYDETGYLNYVSLLNNGKQKEENLKLLFERAKQYESASFKGLYHFIQFMDKMKLSSGDMGSAKIIGENENVVRMMSIHKSKGLEFPVVILAQTGKKFNFMNLNRKILLHRELGIGPQLINETKHVEYKTLAKTAIGMKIREEMLAEEMRILYVALTRAKEKLIITGTQKDFEEQKREKEKLVSMTFSSEKIEPIFLKKYVSYLHWLLLVYFKRQNEIREIAELHVIPKEDLLQIIEEKPNENWTNIIKSLAIKHQDDQQKKQIQQELNWKYPLDGLEKVPAKTSVTSIKEKTKVQEQTETELEVPKFLRKEETNFSGAHKGTLMHLCLKELKEKQEYNEANIEEMIHQLVQKELMTEAESKVIDRKKLLQYTQSSLWKELKKAKEIHKEQPFYINLPADQIYDIQNNKDISVLVQGIIDLYFITQEDEIVLVDYKTDYVSLLEEEQLINKYQEQLILYRNALEQCLHKKVSKTLIYSLALNKTIQVF